MQITRNSVETGRGPSDWFRRRLHRHRRSPSRFFACQRKQRPFTPGARTAWHTHPNSQTIWVTEGAGLRQRRGGPIEVLRPGDRVFFEPDEEHWHGAAATRVHDPPRNAEVDVDGNPATWGDHLTDDEYAAAPTIDG